MDLGHLVLVMLLLVAVAEIWQQRTAKAKWETAAGTATAAWQRSLGREMELLNWKARHWTLVQRYAVPAEDAPSQSETVN
jgi:hypothetical protein